MASIQVVQQISPVTGQAAHERVSPIELNLLGIRVHTLTQTSLHEAIGAAIAEDSRYLFAHHNLHSLYLWHRELRKQAGGMLHRFYERAHLTMIDGMSMVLIARLHGFRVRRSHRIAYNYALPKLLALAEVRGWRVFYLGSSKQVAATAASLLQEAYPRLTLSVHHGYFEKTRAGSENQAVLEAIADFKPHILFVGMGMPIQENWIEENFEALRANVILPSGATLDYFSGALPRPPEWIGKAGLEWAYRLINEPHRLAFRYLAEPLLILISLLQIRMRRLGRETS